MIIEFSVFKWIFTKFRVVSRLLGEFFATNLNETTSELRKNENCLVGNFANDLQKAWRIILMKTVTKFLTLGLMLVAFGAASVTSTFAQTTPEECEKIYQDFLAKRKGPDKATFEAAVASGESFLSKCNVPDQKEVVDYVTKQVPKIKEAIVALEKAKVFEAFNGSIPAKNWAVAFSSGKQIINDTPNDVDVPLVLASIGFDNAVANPPVDTYNADAISMAKLALQKMEQGTGSGTGNFGAFAYVYKTAACADGKTNATGWMNYTIGNIMYYRMNQKKEALPYLYKATQVGCETKDKIAGIYRTIGNYYIDEFKRIETEKNAAYDAIKDLPTTDPTFAEKEKKYKDLVALQKGYMERTMDAIARAYKVAVNAKEPAAFQTAQLNLAKQFYGFRNGQTPTVPFDTWLAGVTLSKPFPDPTAAVEPIVEAEPTTAPTAMTTAPETPSASGTDTRARTVNTPATGTAKTGTSTTAAKTATTTTAAKTATTTTKTPAKPAPKKKGTR